MENKRNEKKNPKAVEEEEEAEEEEGRKSQDLNFYNCLKNTL